MKLILLAVAAAMGTATADLQGCMKAAHFTTDNACYGLFYAQKEGHADGWNNAEAAAWAAKQGGRIAILNTAELLDKADADAADKTWTFEGGLPVKPDLWFPGDPNGADLRCGSYYFSGGKRGYTDDACDRKMPELVLEVPMNALDRCKAAAHFMTDNACYALLYAQKEGHADGWNNAEAAAWAAKQGGRIAILNTAELLDKADADAADKTWTFEGGLPVKSDLWFPGDPNGADLRCGSYYFSGGKRGYTDDACDRKMPELVFEVHMSALDRCKLSAHFFVGTTCYGLVYAEHSGYPGGWDNAEAADWAAKMGGRVAILDTTELLNKADAVRISPSPTGTNIAVFEAFAKQPLPTKTATTNSDHYAIGGQQRRGNATDKTWTFDGGKAVKTDLWYPGDPNGADLRCGSYYFHGGQRGYTDDACDRKMPELVFEVTPDPCIRRQTPGNTRCWLTTNPACTHAYAGDLAVTTSGKTCQAWIAHTPHSHVAKNTGPSNHCRNPDGEPGGPWCYTTDPEQRWEYCFPTCTADAVPL